jgi:hypothetical protein
VERGDELHRSCSHCLAVVVEQAASLVDDLGSDEIVADVVQVGKVF